MSRRECHDNNESYILAAALPFPCEPNSDTGKKLIGAIPGELWVDYNHAETCGETMLACDRIADWVARNYKRILGIAQ